MAEHLVEFLQRGVRWEPCQPAGSEAALLLEIARRTRVHAGAGPVSVALEHLGDKAGREYSLRQIERASTRLVELGLIDRQQQAGRSRVGRSLPALTELHPLIVDLARVWQEQRVALRAAGKRGADTYPARIVLELPMTFDTPPPRPDLDSHRGSVQRKNVFSSTSAQIPSPVSKPSIHAGSQGGTPTFCRPGEASHPDKMSGTGIHNPPTPTPAVVIQAAEGALPGAEEGGPRGTQPCLSVGLRSDTLGARLVAHALEGGGEASPPAPAPGFGFSPRQRRSPLPAIAGKGGCDTFPCEHVPPTSTVVHMAHPLPAQRAEGEKEKRGLGPSRNSHAEHSSDHQDHLLGADRSPSLSREIGALDGPGGGDAFHERVRSSRRLAHWIMTMNGANQDHLTRLMTIRCDSSGRYTGGELPIGRHSENAESQNSGGGLILTQWKSGPDRKGIWRSGVFETVWKRSDDHSKKKGEFIGESLYAGPRDGSRIILLDDVKQGWPIFDGFACAILETSSKNYQHLYVADRNLTNQERYLVTKEIHENCNREFDGGALCGHQAHRWPGSVNLKPGKKRFWTKLIYLEAGKKVNVSRLLINSSTTPMPNSTPSTALKAPQKKMLVPVRAAGTGADKTASGKDWHQAILMIQAGHNLRQIESFLLESLAQPDRRQRTDAQRADNAARTLSKLISAGFLTG